MSYQKTVEVWTQDEVVANIAKLTDAFQAATGQELDLTVKQAKAVAEALKGAGILIGTPANTTQYD